MDGCFGYMHAKVNRDRSISWNRILLENVEFCASAAIISASKKRLTCHTISSSAELLVTFVFVAKTMITFKYQDIIDRSINTKFKESRWCCASWVVETCRWDKDLDVVWAACADSGPTCVPLYISTTSSATTSFQGLKTFFCVPTDELLYAGEGRLAQWGRTKFEFYICWLLWRLVHRYPFCGRWYCG